MTKTKKDKILSLRHFIFLEMLFEKVAPQVMLWEESPWWPKRGVLQFKRLEGVLQDGAHFQLRLRALLPKIFEVEVVRFVQDREIHFLFKTGILNGVQIIRVEDRSNGTRVNYEMSYEVKGLLNKILWSLMYQKLWDKGMALVLGSLKDYLLAQASADQEKKFEG